MAGDDHEAAPRSRAARFLHRHPVLGSVALGLGGVVLLWISVEAGSLLILKLRGEAGRFIEHSGGFLERDDYLGIRAKPDVRVDAWKDGPDGPVYRCTYTTDAYGRRVTPIPDGAAPEEFALFFGCSFTFGEGVNDGETLPARFSEAAPRFRSYNYGLKAYGPQQCYLHARRPGLAGEIRERRGIAVYTFIDHHIDRAIGTMRVSASWGRPLPLLTLEDGRIQPHGSFGTGRPAVQLLYDALNVSPALQLIGYDTPPLDRPWNYTLIAAMIAEARQALAATFEQVAVYVVIFPESKRGGPLIARLDDLDVTCLDYAKLYQEADGPAGMFLADGHPSAAGLLRVAQRIAADVR